jgi:putative NADH-flavin reductase
MQITILGASGRIGQLLVPLALANGHQITALTHTKNPFTPQTGLRVLQGDISDPIMMQQATEGSQVIISTLGSWGTKQKTTLSRAMNTLVPLLEADGSSSLVISLTGAAALIDTDQPSFLDTVNRWLLLLIAPKILRDAETHIKTLQTSTINWKVVRAPVMNDKPHQAYVLRATLAAPWLTIARQSVAHCLLDLAESDQWQQQAPVIYQH